jgi:hypothetical protein
MKQKTQKIVYTARKIWSVRLYTVTYFAVLIVAISPIQVVHAPLLDGDMANAHAIDYKELAKEQAHFQYGWDKEQFKCLGKLWGKESAWNHEAKSPTQDYGIPQRHMSKNTQKQIDKFLDNPVNQVLWGLNYIDSRYGSPCEAWAFHEIRNWY